MPRVLRAVFAMLVMGSIFALPAAAQESTSGTDDLPACAQGPVEGAEYADWQTADLVDARTGETFRISDYSGCTIFVETMATWCSNCMMQLGNVQAAVPEVDPDEVVFLAISVETELSAEDLAAYADNNEFDWTFSVASPDLLGQLVDGFDRAIIVPPSTPHFVIAPDGTVGDLITGIQSTEDIVSLVTELSASGV